MEKLNEYYLNHIDTMLGWLVWKALNDENVYNRYKNDEDALIKDLKDGALRYIERSRWHETELFFDDLFADPLMRIQAVQTFEKMYMLEKLMKDYKKISKL